MIDLSTLSAQSDEDFQQIRELVDSEAARRMALKQIPAQVRELAAQYQDSGGNPDDLVPALDLGTA